MSARSVKLVQVGERLLLGNDLAAARTRRRFDAAGVLAVNVMAAPGAGKTSLIAGTLAALGGRARVGVIEGDIAGSVDTERVLAAGARDAVQINTGGNCHLEAGMVDRALDDLALDDLDLVLIENVGNLVCPTHWALGEHRKICLVGAAEGHDKPVKYPDMFAAADAIVLNKIDLIELVDFDRAAFYEAVRALNPRAPVFEVSCRTGAGLDEWAGWLAGWRATLPSA
ncbi:MAG TPA: hydrogenase nickel incorporation protein HypB [Thermomicrobiales bacterium]|nr:hydrogenase nickel incorporation protein HypB [Thermomicrobiales bacterium]